MVEIGPISVPPIGSYDSDFGSPFKGVIKTTIKAVKGNNRLINQTGND